jgi:ribosomal protein S4
VVGHKKMTFNKESYLGQKLNTAYNQFQFYSKVIKHVRNNFLFTQLSIKEFLKTGSNNTTADHFYFKRLQFIFFG